MVTTEFVVNEEKRTIVCIITTVDDMVQRLAKYGLADEDYDDIYADERVYKGIAKCAPDDTWDETYGMKLAERRAMAKRQGDINSELTKYIKNCRKRLENLEKYGMLKTPGVPLK